MKLYYQTKSCHPQIIYFFAPNYCQTLDIYSWCGLSLVFSLLRNGRGNTRLYLVTLFLSTRLFFTYYFQVEIGKQKLFMIYSWGIICKAWSFFIMPSVVHRKLNTQCWWYITFCSKTNQLQWLQRRVIKRVALYKEH